MNRMLILSMLLLLGACPPAESVERTDGPLPDYLKSLSCRIVTRAAAPGGLITLLVEASLDTTSSVPADFTFSAPLLNGRVLTSKVQHVYVGLPRERFNVTLLLDGKSHLRINHMDLDIYAETAVDGSLYVLHCFRETL